MDYFQALLIAHTTVLVALLVAPWATAGAAGLRFSLRGMAKYVVASLAAFYVLGFVIDLWCDGAVVLALLASQLLLGAWWFPRCVGPRPTRLQGRRGWRWWTPPMLALGAETAFELLSWQARALMPFA